jgi:hypothetical protein
VEGGPGVDHFFLGSTIGIGRVGGLVGWEDGGVVGWEVGRLGRGGF